MDMNYWLGRKYDILERNAAQRGGGVDPAVAARPGGGSSGGNSVLRSDPPVGTGGGLGFVPPSPEPEATPFAPRFVSQGRPSSTSFSDPNMGITGIGDSYRASRFELPAFTTRVGGEARDPSEPFRFAKGTARVPGKGDPRKDTVPAKLAPGEAVLNKPAADMAGRGLIAALNKLGAQKMGMP